MNASKSSPTNSGKQHMKTSGKIQINHSHHKTRKEKQYDKLRKTINKFKRKLHKQISNPQGEKFKKIKELQTELRALNNKITDTKIDSLTKRINNANKKNDKRTVFKLLKHFNEPEKANESKTIKLIRAENGQLVSKTTDIHEAFRSVWKEMFTHQGDNLAREINEIKVDPPELELTEKCKT